MMKRDLFLFPKMLVLADGVFVLRYKLSVMFSPWEFPQLPPWVSGVRWRAKTNTGTEQLDVFVQCTAVMLTVFESSSVQ